MTQLAIERITIDAAARWGALQLSVSDTASLDAQLLLGHVLGRSRAGLVAHGTDELLTEQWSTYRHLIKRRSQGEPVAYLRGYVEWYGTEYIVTPDVLIPRPETEVLLEKALALARRVQATVVVDVGTGCGAIASQVAQALPGARVYATDISERALRVARDNLRRLAVDHRVTLQRGNLLQPLPEPPDLVIANLPYLSRGMLETVVPDVRFEPREALYAGESGLELYEEMLDQLRPHGSVPVVAEIDPRQAQAATALFSRALPELWVTVSPDHAGLPRVVMAAPVEAQAS